MKSCHHHGYDLTEQGYSIHETFIVLCNSLTSALSAGRLAYSPYQ
jgi:hypothetical protein